ncbi:MAG TPA: hypothetical protein VM122_01830 [Usitatibacter sp.]|nr:hypothetical protein [Usitatibacter sp.]
MPRAPLTGVVSGLVGVIWAAAGLVAAAWAATAALDAAKGFELATWMLGNSGVELPWSPEYVAGVAIAHLPVVAVGAALALLMAWSHLRKARIAFRPDNVSQDGKGELRVSAIQPRVGRPFDGSIMLRDVPTPGEEFDVTLTAIGPAGAVAHRAEQKVRARQGAHGVNLPFRFDVPASAPASGGGNRWRLEFGPAGRTRFRRSAFDVSLGRPSEIEIRAASVPRAEAHVPRVDSPVRVADTASPAASSAPQAAGYVDHIEKLYGALGGKLTDRQRELIRAKLSGQEAEALKQQLEGLRKLRPDHVKLLKYAAIGAFVFFFVLPFVFSVLGVILAAIFGH